MILYKIPFRRIVEIGASRIIREIDQAIPVVIDVVAALREARAVSFALIAWRVAAGIAGEIDLPVLVIVLPVPALREERSGTETARGAARKAIRICHALGKTDARALYTLAELADAVGGEAIAVFRAEVAPRPAEHPARHPQAPQVRRLRAIRIVITLIGPRSAHAFALLLRVAIGVGGWGGGGGR